MSWDDTSEVAKAQHNKGNRNTMSATVATKTRLRGVLRRELGRVNGRAQQRQQKHNVNGPGYRDEAMGCPETRPVVCQALSTTDTTETQCQRAWIHRRDLGIARATAQQKQQKHNVRPRGYNYED